MYSMHTKVLSIKIKSSRTSSLFSVKGFKNHMLCTQSEFLQMSAFWRQQATHSLLLYLLMLTIEFTGGEPQTFHNDLNSEKVSSSSFQNTETNQNTNDLNLGRIHGQPKTKRYINCDSISRCFDGMPTMNDTEIPSTAKAVSAACQMYDLGMNCVENWVKGCLPKSHREKVKESINGAHEMFTFLCKDPKFRADYLKHTECYKKLSVSYDHCSREFIEGLRKNTKHDYTAFCCIRFEFLRCVSKSSSYFCSLNATQFLMKMAETLVRSRVRARSPDYCMYVHHTQCVPIVENSGNPSIAQQVSSISLFVIYFMVTFLRRSVLV